MNNKEYCKKLITILNGEILLYNNNIERIRNNISQAQNLNLEIKEFLKNGNSALYDDSRNMKRNMQIIKYKEQIEKIRKELASNQKLIANYNKGNYCEYDDDAFYTYHLNIYTKKQERHWNIYIWPQQATDEKVALLCTLNHKSVEDNKRLLNRGGNYYGSALDDVPTLIKYNISISGFDAFVSNECKIPLYDKLFNINTRSEFIETCLEFAGKAAVGGFITLILGIGIFALFAALVASMLAGINSIRQKNIIKQIIKFEEYIAKQDNVMEKFYEFNKVTKDLHNQQRSEDIAKVLKDINQSYSYLTNILSF